MTEAFSDSINDQLELFDSISLTEEEFYASLKKIFLDDMIQALLKWAVELFFSDDSDFDFQEYMSEVKTTHNGEGELELIYWCVPACLYRFYKYDFSYEIKDFLESISGRKPTKEELDALHTALIAVDKKVMTAISHF